MIDSTKNILPGKIEPRLIRLDAKQQVLIYDMADNILRAIEGPSPNAETVIKCMSNNLYLDALSIVTALTTPSFSSKN